VLAGMAAGGAVGALRGGRFSMQQVAGGAFGNALGDSIVANSQPGVDWTKAPDESAAEEARLNRYVAAADGSSGGASRDWFAGMSMLLGPGSSGPRFGGGSVGPTAEELQATFRRSERDYRSATERSVAGSAYAARRGDSISRILGMSDPQAIGNFMRANNLSGDRIEVGRNYFVPDSAFAYGNAAALGQTALSASNERVLAAAGRETQRLASMAALRSSSAAVPSQTLTSGTIPTGNYAAPPGYEDRVDGIAGYLLDRLDAFQRTGLGQALQGLPPEGAAVGGLKAGLLFWGRLGRVEEVVAAEAAALERMSANARTPPYWAELRSAYQQARGQVDFAHIEADVTLSANGKVTAKGGHFSTSPQLRRVPSTETVSPNGVIYGQVKLLGPDGNFYLKTNNKGFSSMTPESWSLAQAKGEMSQAWMNRWFDPVDQVWTGRSSGVDFLFHESTKRVPVWRGYPVQP